MGGSMKNKGDDAGIAALLELISTLRSERGCPWDRKQTPQTMKKYLLEECGELVEVIGSGDPAAVLEECGDVLFILTFLIRLYEEQGHFDLQSVCQEAHANALLGDQGAAEIRHNRIGAVDNFGKNSVAQIRAQDVGRLVMTHHSSLWTVGPRALRPGARRYVTYPDHTRTYQKTSNLEPVILFLFQSLCQGKTRMTRQEPAHASSLAQSWLFDLIRFSSALMASHCW